LFDVISIWDKRTDLPDSPFDIGFLAEAMLFYGHVHVFAGRVDLERLINAFGPDLLVEYLREELFTLTYVSNATGVKTENGVHLVDVIEIVSQDLQRIASELMVAAIGKAGKGRRTAKRFLDLCNQTRFGGIVGEYGRQDAQDVDYTRAVARTILKREAPDYAIPDPLIFDAEPASNGVRMATNIDFGLANQVYHHRVSPAHSSLSTAHILSQIVGARADVDLASRIDAEMALEGLRANILRDKLEAIDRRTRSEARLSEFKDLVVDDVHDVRAAINVGARSFVELRELIHKAKRFRSWLADKSADAALAKEYFREITKESWVDKLPNKGLRFAVMAGLGQVIDVLSHGSGVGTAVGTMLGAADTFILDKVLKGWRPNQFIDEDLKKFLARPK
jgi:hypothetical protein